MTLNLYLQPIKMINGTVTLPGSKSISNRALLLSAMSYGITNLNNLLNSDDTIYMLNALKKINIKYETNKNFNTCKVWGNINSFNTKKIKLFLGNAGTVMRPLTAVFSLKGEQVILTGDLRMKERPIGHLIDSLIQGGAKIKYLEKNNYPPLCIDGGFKGGKITIESSISSQFLTSLLIISPLAVQDTTIKIIGELVSKPYIDITINLMKNFGVEIQNFDYKKFKIKSHQKYKSPGNYIIESDASSASYFLAAAAIKGGTVKINNINKNSIQGDIKFAKILEKMGAKITWGDNYISCTRNYLNGINLDANDIPDAAMTIATTAVFAKGPTIIKNIFNWRLKETDRLAAMSNELRKIGAIVEEGKDFIKINPPKKIKYSKINTYNDHRMAMCFSLLALSKKSVTILDHQCVSKTFPDYFIKLKEISIN